MMSRSTMTCGDNLPPSPPSTLGGEGWGEGGRNPSRNIFDPEGIVQSAQAKGLGHSRKDRFEPEGLVRRNPSFVRMAPTGPGQNGTPYPGLRPGLAETALQAEIAEWAKPVGRPMRRATAIRTFLLWTMVVLFCGIDADRLQAQLPVPKKKFQVTVPYDGPEVFARLLDHAGLNPIKTFREFVNAPAEKTILIVFGDIEILTNVEFGDTQIFTNLKKKDGEIGGFLSRGGTLLIATDRSFSFDRRFNSLAWDGVRSGLGGLVNLEQNFLNEPNCPTITHAEIRQIDHPLFRDVTKPIATNCPGVHHVE